MKIGFLIAAALALPIICRGDAQIPADLPGLAQRAVSPDKTTADAAIAALREAGPDGLQALVDGNRDALNKGIAYLPKPIVTTGVGRVYVPARATTPEWDRLAYALDIVGQQHDNWGSRLYWYTDLDAAKTAAQARHKPILALYLLGKLSDELSCANSRLFRTALYPDAKINAYLRGNFVLYWHTVRPVPKVTIDFGDGRKIETTITGNSIHYVLDEQGRPVDALPGMYGPAAFLRALEPARAEAVLTGGLEHPARVAALGDYHRARIAAAATDWSADLQRLRIPPPNDPTGALLAMDDMAVRERANAAAVAALAEFGVDPGPPIGALPAPRYTGLSFLTPRLDSPVFPAAAATDLTWKQLAGLHPEDALFDKDSTSMMASKNPDMAPRVVGFSSRTTTATGIAPLTASKVAMDLPLISRMMNFQRTVAEDSVRNEYDLHARLHQYMAGPGNDLSIDQLNQWVYADLFFTPMNDPWLGLLPQGVYTGLVENGTVPGN